MGQNDRGVQYLDLELIMRDETHVQKGIEWAENPPKAITNKPARDIRVGRAAAEDYDHSGPVGENKL
jgi:hypothetical protein